MRSVILLLLFHFSLTGVFAESSLRSARQAEALLGPETWTRVIHIENATTNGVYPQSFYALIFEFSGILWFYTETDGTQSFSRWTNRLEQEKSDFHLGLLAIDPGFVRYSIMEASGLPPVLRGELPNGCLIESLVAGRDRLGQGDGIRSARLVMYYAKERREGHCVLAYETTQGVFVLDPTRERRARRVGDQWPRDPVDIAQAAWPEGRRGQIRDARTLDFPLPAVSTTVRPAFAVMSPASGGNPSSPPNRLGHG